METTLEVKVPEFKKIFEGDKDVVYYTINLSSDKKTWTINKRFSELEKLNADLKLNHGGLPDFPTKTLFSLKKYEDIDDRRVKIEAYLKVILKDTLSAS